MNYKNVLDKLESYLKDNSFKGYDPYDTLNSPIISRKFGDLFSVLAIQFQKRNPINIRPVLGIKKEYNPKAMGLFLSAYSILYKKTKDKKYLDEAKFFYDWLKTNYTKGYSGYCWGYNFPWASPDKYLNKYSPTSVVTGFVCKGLFDYYVIIKSEEIVSILESACKFLENDLKIFSDDAGICFSYTSLSSDNCYNASLLAAEIFAKTYSITNTSEYKSLASKAMYYVIEKQHNDGHWNYSLNVNTNKEREQIDFHQGYILDSIYDIKKYCEISDEIVDLSLSKGLEFYKENQFTDKGVSYWRYPKRLPVDIHNQAQGIITLSKLEEISNSGFQNIIADWTINNMLSKKGFFFYRNYSFYKIKIPYIRWSQAWMFLALTNLIEEK